MNQAIQMLKTTRPTFYRWLRSGRLKGMKVGRQWRFYRADIERFLKGQGPRIELAADIGPLLAELSEQVTNCGASLPKHENGNDAMAAVRLMLHLTVAAGASDLHLSAQSDGIHVRLRLDGVLHPAAVYDARLHGAIVEGWKSLMGCDVHQTALPQDGRAVTETDAGGEPVDLRANFLPAHGGEAVTVRVLRPDDVHLTFERLDFTPRDEALLRRCLDMPSGLVLCTGPTGSGKTTTLYTCFKHLIRPEVKVMSIEDPVELQLDGAVQVQVQPKIGLTFPVAIRSCFRGDPDVIMVGEVRDPETANLCVQMALTGHLVLTTLHTQDAATGLARLVEIGVPAFVAADATRLVVAQRLVRRLCPACSKADTPAESLLRQAAQRARAGGLDWDGLAASWRGPVGCRECRFTGYSGRSLIGEALEVTPEIGSALRRGATVGELRTIAIGQGMTTLAAHGLRRAAAGQTSLAEVFAVVPGA
jgi:general secretion pathway protein E